MTIAVMILVLLSGVVFPAQGQTFWPVNTLDDLDDGQCNPTHCSFREAINAANINTGVTPDSIVFRTSGTITLGQALPSVRGALIINGNSSPGGISIDGSMLAGGASHGLVVTTDEVKVYGLRVQNFPGIGLQFLGGQNGNPEHLSNIYIAENVIVQNGRHGIYIDMGSDVIIRENYLGTDPMASPLLGNQGDGIQIPKVIGDNSFVHGNVIGGNLGDGLDLQIDGGSRTGGLRITGNFIGTDPSLTANLGQVTGIVVAGAGNIVIGAPGDSTNVIAFNETGILRLTAEGKTLYDNHFICNDDPIAIDGPTIPNNICVGDGVVNGSADPSVRVDVYLVDSTMCPDQPCQGSELIGTTMSDAAGFWAVIVNIAAGTAVTAMATDGMGTSSLFSSCSDFVDVVASNTGPYCDEEINNVELLAAVSGNTAQATYRWFGPNFYQSTEQNPSGPLFRGLYKLVVDFGECVFDTQYTEVIFSTTRNEFITEFCDGEFWSVNGNRYGTGGALTGMEVLPGATEFGCDSVIFFDLEQQPNIEARLFSPEFACAGDTIELTLEALPASYAPFNIVYTDGVNPPDTVFDLFHNDKIRLEALADMEVQLLDITTQLTPCEPILGTADTLEVSALSLDAQLSDYNGFNVSCKSAEDGSIMLTPNGAVGPVIYEWAPNFLSGDFVDNLGAGLYSITATDDSGCNTVLDTTLAEPPGPDPDITIFEPSCLGALDGGVTIESVGNVLGTLFLSLDSITFEEVSALPFTIDTLPAGVVSLYFWDDVDPCVLVERLIIPNGDVPFVNAGGTRSITAGDSVQLGFSTDITNPIITWSPPEFFDCPTCANPFVSPPGTQYVTASLTNEDGCSALDSVLIQVFIPKRVFIPNVFSPNGDGINDFFTISSNQYALFIESMIVLNRGGVTVFSGENLPLDDNSLAWDGNFKDEPLNPGVFTYLINVRFNDDQVIPFSGTVTLIR